MDPAALDHDEHIVLADGRHVTIRHIRPNDAPRLQALHRRLSRRSVRLRFFTPFRELPGTMAERFANVDFRERAAFVATLEGEEDVLAVGRYEMSVPGRAEMAFVVQDAYQGQGIARALLRHIVECARANGVTELVAMVLAENTPMLDLLRSAGFPMTVQAEQETHTITLQIDEPAALARANAPLAEALTARPGAAHA